MGEAHIGSQIWDQNHAIKIKTGDMPEKQYIALVEDKIKFSQLSNLVKSYIRKPIQVDIEFDVLPEQQHIQLGESWHQLGVSSHMSNRDPKNTKRVILNIC